MLNEIKMRKAHHYLEQAIFWDTLFSTPAIGGSDRHKRVEMLLNKACALELEALGFKVYAFSFSGPWMGQVHSYHPAPVYENGAIPLPYRPPLPEYLKRPSVAQSVLYH